MNTEIYTDGKFTIELTCDKELSPEAIEEFNKYYNLNYHEFNK